MRHRKRGRTLGRSPSHRKALLRNLVSNLFLTERDAEGEENAPKIKGRIVTTLQKAKEVRPLVEKCVTIACRSLGAEEEARQYETDAERGTDQWREWRSSDQWQKWNSSIAPSIAARRRVLRLIGDKQAVRILFDEIAPRFTDRPGGYTRIMRLAIPRLGDAGTRAILEFVGTHDRVTERSEKPAFSDDESDSEETAEATANVADDTSEVADEEMTNDEAPNDEGPNDEDPPKE